MAYTAWSVVYGEQPTAAKWNQLGTNDAGFKDGTNIDAGAITYAKLLASIFSGQVSSIANAGSAGGTVKYINLGGIKLAWGFTGALGVSGSGFVSSGSYAINFPAGFFTTIESAGVYHGGGTATNTQYLHVVSNQAATTTAMQFFLVQSSGTNGALSRASFFAIGT